MFENLFSCGVIALLFSAKIIEHTSSEDPPIYLFYSTAPGIGQQQKDPKHNANFGVKLQEKLKSLHVECELVYPAAPKSNTRTTWHFFWKS